jgi:restriction system protein
MAYKMAKNSLFAILLRSPWWVSLVIVGAIVLVSNALLTPEVRVFGWMGAFPFVVICGIALKRQWGQPSAKQEAAAFKQLQGMSHAELSAALVAGFERDGYTVQKSKRAGSDLLLARQGQSTVVSTQRWKMARPGVEVLKELQQAQMQLKAEGAVFVHLYPLSDSAQSWVKSQSLTCLTGSALARALALSKA